MSEQYRLLAGMHEQAGQVYKAGQIVVADKDLCSMFNVRGYSPKFERIGGIVSAKSQTWDPEVETIEQFSERMRQMREHPKQDGLAIVWDPKVETLEQFYRRMQPHSGLPQETVAEAAKRGFQQVIGQPQQGKDGGSTTAVTSTKTQQQLEVMSLQELQKHAETEEIDLGHAKTKADIVKVIRTYQGN